MNVWMIHMLPQKDSRANRYVMWVQRLRDAGFCNQTSHIFHSSSDKKRRQVILNHLGV